MYLLAAALALGAVISFVTAAWLPRWWPILPGLALAVAALFVANEHSPERKRLDPNPKSGFRIAALGDSYISGEGAQRYFPGTDRPTNNCHRAATAHPYLIAAKLHALLLFPACSGAETRHVLRRPQHPDSDPRVFGGEPQIDVLRRARRPSVVLLSVGGNDAGFVKIGAGCVLHDCRDSASYWIHRLDSRVYPALRRTYRAVRRAARGAPVLALNYPIPIAKRYCLIGFLPAQLRFIRDVFAKRLNYVVKTAAAEEGVRLVDISGSLAGHQLCANRKRPWDAGINFVHVGHTAGERLALSAESLATLAHGTFHPNRLGHALIEKRVLPAVEAARDGKLGPAPPRPRHGLRPFVPRELKPPVGGAAFPPRTPCTGTKLTVVTAVSVNRGVKTIRLSDLRGGSTVCYRGYLERWRSTPASADGVANVPVAVEHPGVGGINEVLAQLPGGVWRKLVVSRIGAADQFAQPKKGTNTAVYVFAAVLALAVAGAVLLHRRRHGRRA